MFPKITIIILQIVLTIQQAYDDDINVAYPAKLEYLMPIPITESIREDINNCSCKTIPDIETTCEGKTCQSIPLIANSTIQIFKIRLTSIINIGIDDLTRMSNLKAMEIEANVKLVKITPGVFKKMSELCNLTISTNMNLKSLEANVFEGLINLKILYMQKNGFRHVIDITTALSPAFLPNLLFLDMSEHIFHDIFEFDFLPMNRSRLNELNIILCELENMHVGSLKYLRNLTDLRLGQNLFNKSVITDLIESTLSLGIPLNNLNLYDAGLRKIVPNQLMRAVGRSNITRICLARNHFDYINDDSFPDMPQLYVLDLRDNSIIQITLNAFKRLPNLKYLLLGENKLSIIPTAAMLRTVQLLDLAGNSNDGYWPSYFSIEDCKFVNMPMLDNLQLSYNSIAIITTKSFKGLTNLTVLNLKNASLSDIQLGAFRPLTKLLHLNLINNPFPIFMTLTAEIFEGLSNLQVLLLGGCSIKNLTTEQSIFKHMPNLTYLGLERNNLHSILAYQLLPLVKLAGINVANNKITTWKKRMFNQSTLTSFFGQTNKITYFTTAMLEDWQPVETLLIDDNPFTCDCTWSPVVNWLNTHKSALIYRKYKDDDIARCIGPARWRREGLLDFLHQLLTDPNICEQDSSDVEALIVPITIICIIVIVLICVCLCSWRVFRNAGQRETPVHEILL